VVSSQSTEVVVLLTASKHHGSPSCPWFQHPQEIVKAKSYGYSNFYVSGPAHTFTSFLALPPWFEEMVELIASFNAEEEA